MMRDDELEALLKSADAAIEAPRIGDGLAERVRHRAARQRRRRGVGGALAAAMLLAVGISLWPWDLAADRQRKTVDVPRPPATQPVTSPEEIAALRAEVAALREETAAMLALVRANRREREGMRSPQRPLVDVPVDPLRESIEQVAYLIVHRGDQMIEDQGDRQAAIEAYRRVIELFPRTAGAQAARKKLETLLTEKGV